jgi:glycosyltransferase involved in cell wall biosynthesis
VIRAVIIAYNEARMLPGCLESVHSQVDEIVVVDGAYRRFPHTVPYSTDKTRQIAEAYGARWIECPPDGWERQYHKRTAYLVGAEGDWYLHIDADERLVGTLPELVDGNIYALLIQNRAGVPGWCPRIFQHRGHMRYEGSHNALWSDDRLVHLAGAIKVPPDDCRLLHLAHLRRAERQRDKVNYYAWQKPAEQSYRRRHGI